MIRLTTGMLVRTLTLVACVSISITGAAADIDLTPHFDLKAPLANPHKGWYHHFPDNHLTRRYPVAADRDLTDFPGMDHLYMRLAWAYLQPEEDKFNWEVIDATIKKWTGKGLGIAFRISCRETGTDRIEQQYATPRWVKEAGAQGGYYYKGKETGPDGPWEPVFDDPVFLQKLERFLKAFGKRYDGKPWLRYVDIGSIGDWGEGHTSSGSRRDYGYEVRKHHIDLYRKYFPTTQLIVTDDYVYSVRDLAERNKLHQYALDQGLSYRDDSILVDWYIKTYSKSWTVRSPEFFADVYLTKPTVFELEHYASVRRLGNWNGKAGSSLARHGDGKTGADFFQGALSRLHATYIGYHGDASVWRSENPELTHALLNQCGYWYVLHRVAFDDAWQDGVPTTVSAVWENRGVAPAYHDYHLVMRLEGPRSHEISVDAKNCNWVPRELGRTYTEKYRFNVPSDLQPGRYSLKLKLYWKAGDRDVLLALSHKLMDTQGFYRIGELDVRR